MTLSGCSGLPDLAHRIEGGQVAKPRQPPPGVSQPYPNLASVPSRPPPPDAAALTQVFQSLVADRENARHLTTAPPRPDPSSPSASPELFGLGTAPPPVPATAEAKAPPPQPVATATLAAASGPAPEPTPAPAAPTPPPAAPIAATAPSLILAAVPPEVPAAP
ncbi:MAG: hypothetical protein JOY66_15850, partial [Acetobacteraceae bacterium]|nr:hypothetical protein [Acetobacteraceae bacterium]